jgi:cytochrome c biogenesis protein CcmG, thiol:disulfide interchange protein DsbE
MNRRARAAVIGVCVAAPITFVLSLGFRGQSGAIASPLVGHSAPPFVLRTLDGSRTVSLAALRGRPVVLNFWQSSCIPCRQEHPLLVHAYHLYGHKIAFIGVSYEDGVTSAERFLSQRGGGWPTVRDPGGVTAIDYGVYGIPETFFIDRSGIVRYKSVGPVTSSVLNRQIHIIVRERA